MKSRIGWPNFTLAELLVLFAVVAIVLALILDLNQRRYLARVGIWSIAFSAEGDRLVAVMSDGSVRTYDTATGKEGWALAPSGRTLTSTTSNGRFIARSAEEIEDGKELRILRIWDLQSGQELNRRHFDVFGQNEISTDGRLVATEKNGEIYLLPLGNPAGAVQQLRQPPISISGAGWVYEWTNSMAPPRFDAQSKYIYLLCDNGLVKWDVETQASTRGSLMDPSSSRLMNGRFALSPDGEMVALARDDLATFASGVNYSVQFFNSADLTPIRTLTIDKKIDAITFLDQGKSLGLFGSDTLEIRDVATFEIQKRAPLVSDWHAIATTPDGKRLAMADKRSVYLFKDNAFQRLATFEPRIWTMVGIVIGLLIAVLIWAALRIGRSRLSSHSSAIDENRQNC